MGPRIGRLILRKLTTTFVTAMIFSFALVLISMLNGFEFEYNQGNQFIGWFFVYFMYSGAVIVTYGNLVSIVMEAFQKKWFPHKDWLYVLILGVFGLANGFIFQSKGFALLGMVAAILYGIIDKWLAHRRAKSKGIKSFLLILFAALFLCWGVLQLTSPPVPPFTKEDAVRFATSGEGTVIDHFPSEIGNWEGTIDGYQVKRETSAAEIGEEIYSVTFTESWKKGSETGTWELSYKIERGSLTASGGRGETPPYYNGE